jgi:hypothetical protein
MINKVSFLVLLYNKEIQKSNTLLSLLCSSLIFNNCKLVIWNNGPCNLNSVNVDEFVKLGFDVDIIETIDNISLSSIYNSFFEKYISDTYVILDDDSNLHDGYLISTLSSSKNELSVPIILADDKITGPVVNGERYSEECKCSKISTIMGIGSGIIIGSNICERIKNSYGNVFDERFYFYGVDSTFFMRINKIGLGSLVRVIDGFEHSLSRLEIENAETTKFRKKERAYDLALQIKFYDSPLIALKKIVKMLIIFFNNLFFLKNQNISLYHFIFAMLRGKHYKM